MQPAEGIFTAVMWGKCVSNNKNLYLWCREGGGGRDIGRPPGVRGELLLSRTMWAHWPMVGTRHNDACPRKLVMVRVFRTKLHGQHYGMLWNISVESVESVESTGVYCPVETCSQTDSKWLPRHLQQESVRIIHSITPLSRDPHTFGRTNTTYIKYTPHISSGGGKWNEDLENMYLGNVLNNKTWTCR